MNEQREGQPLCVPVAKKESNHRVERDMYHNPVISCVRKIADGTISQELGLERNGVTLHSLVWLLANVV